MKILDLFKGKKKFKGKFIREVWDFRLSKGCPYLYCDDQFWTIRIWANKPMGKRQMLKEHVTDIPATGNPHDEAAIALCYQWLYSVRDDFARDDIDEIKPRVLAMHEVDTQ
jgi:hypothetical protein